MIADYKSSAPVTSASSRLRTSSISLTMENRCLLLPAISRRCKSVTRVFESAALGVRLVRVAEDDHMVVGGDLELIQGAAVRYVTHCGRDLLVSEGVEAGGGDHAIGSHHRHLRAGTDVIV